MTSPSPADAPAPTVSIAPRIAEAELLLAHAGRQGLPLADADIEAVVQAKEALRNGRWEASTEVAFWRAFGHLAEAIKPITLPMLQAAEHGQREPRERARLQVLRYQIGSVVCLVLMLIFQAYWLMGSMLMEDIRQFDTRINELMQQRRNLQTLIPQENRGDSLELSRINLDLDTYFNRKQASYDILEVWKPSGLFPQMMNFSDIWASTTAKANTEIEMRFTLQVIQLYILPLFYGLLGAFAYLLRSLTRDLTSYILPAEAKVSYRLRLQLGALAGLAIGWFITPDITVGSLSPLAIAFLAGYSVEVLFAAMDRAIARFAGHRGKAGQMEASKPDNVADQSDG